MAEYVDREQFIPLRRSDLIDLLCADKGLSDADQTLFRQFCRLVTATYHFQYNQKLEELKESYAPFDPNSDTQELVRRSAEEEQRRLNDLFSDFGWLLERANFKHLSRNDIEPSLHEPSAWGIPMDVDFGAFERIALFARGDVIQKRTTRQWRHFYRKREHKVAVFQRLVMILKLRPHRRIGQLANPDCVYLKVFKDIPKLDIKMLLPSARVHLSLLDRGRIGFPLLSGMGLAVWNILKDLGTLFESVFLSTGTLWGVAVGGIGYGYKSYYGYTHTRQRYSLSLTQSLYYQNLDNNAGVLFRLLDEAEEQECREAFLAYFCLWRHAGERGWNADELDRFVEEYLERSARLKVDFEIGDAIAKLEKLQVVRKTGDRYRAVPVTQAVETLGTAWGRFFPFRDAGKASSASKAGIP
jgi:hypothetical protein